MSEDSMKQIITRAVVDTEFRALLLSNPANALSGYELAEEEKAVFQNLSSEDFENLGETLEKRISRGWSLKPAPSNWTCGACGGGE